MKNLRGIITVILIVLLVSVLIIILISFDNGLLTGNSFRGLRDFFLNRKPLSKNIIVYPFTPYTKPYTLIPSPSSGDAHLFAYDYSYGRINGARYISSEMDIPKEIISSNYINITAAQGEYEPASFILRSSVDIKNIIMTPSSLVSFSGQVINSSNIEMKIVKNWYQSGNIGHRKNPPPPNSPERLLVPELLVYDDSLVFVNTTSKTNYLKISQNNIVSYIEISNKTATIPKNAVFNDAVSLRSFKLDKNQNKQIWITIHVPENATPGLYKGTLSIASRSYLPMNVTIILNVLPFKLEEPLADYGLYYTGTLLTSAPDKKTIQQITTDLQDMSAHGTTFVSMYNQGSNFSKALELWKKYQLDKNNLFYLGTPRVGTQTTIEDISLMIDQINSVKNNASGYGFSSVYFYAIDEANISVVTQEQLAWYWAHFGGGKVWAASGNNNIYPSVNSNNLDVIVRPYNYKTSEISLWDSKGTDIYGYAMPYGGLEIPEVYRRNFGFNLFLSGYDGIFNWAYQSPVGEAWNDFDLPSNVYRDMIFSYPTTNGTINTLEWEGMREGVDDMKYISTLVKLDKSRTKEQIKEWLQSKMEKTNSLDEVRQKVIDEIIKVQKINSISSSNNPPPKGRTPPVAER